MNHYGPRIAALIAELERPNPDDEFPAATRGTLQYLRILQENGPGEIVRAMEANILASLMALRAIVPSMAAVTQVYTSLVVKHTSAAAQGEAAVRSSMKGTVQ